LDNRINQIPEKQKYLLAGERLLSLPSQFRVGNVAPVEIVLGVFIKIMMNASCLIG
jgi:hypothetical protein